ncbi:hypothetical protein AwWohl_09490 [Gammaproteobacteria bacterium]|nr:hypothetical protein AwWohl_09490 [Gammaproteobacteria bacterium]
MLRIKELRVPLLIDYNNKNNQEINQAIINDDYDHKEIKEIPENNSLKQALKIQLQEAILKYLDINLDDLISFTIFKRSYDEHMLR